MKLHEEIMAKKPEKDNLPSLSFSIPDKITDNMFLVDRYSTSGLPLDPQNRTWRELHPKERAMYLEKVKLLRKERNSREWKSKNKTPMEARKKPKEDVILADEQLFIHDESVRKAFKKNKSEVLNDLQLEVVNAIREQDLAAAPTKELASLYQVLHNAERLDDNLSTDNISIIGSIVDKVASERTR